MAIPSTSKASPMTSATHWAFSTSQFVDSLVMAPMTTKMLMNPADTARLTLSARSTEARSAPGRRFSMPRK